MKTAALKILLAASLVVLASPAAFAQGEAIGKNQKMNGLTDAQRAYKVPEGVTGKDATYYSGGIACYAKVFYPKGFNASGKTPGVVLANGWTGTAATTEKYGAIFAERGIVAMCVDYRGWGKSGAFVTISEPIRSDDRKRVDQVMAEVQFKRTRLIPEKQIEDIRNAISWLQGEPGVDRDRIGIWGSSYAGGHVVTVAGRDSRARVVVSQVPAIAGKNAPKEPYTLKGDQLKDAIQRARTGKGGEHEEGWSTKRMVDDETRQKAAEYHPWYYLEAIPQAVPVLFVIAEKDELIRNPDNAIAAMEVLKGPKELVTLTNTSHFEAYIEKPFEVGSKAAADWFVKYLIDNPPAPLPAAPGPGGRGGRGGAPGAAPGGAAAPAPGAPAAPGAAAPGGGRRGGGRRGGAGAAPGGAAPAAPAPQAPAEGTSR